MRYKINVTCPNEDCEADIPVEEVAPYDPGVLSGLPEQCYPPEGGEVEGPDKCHICGTELTDKFWQDQEEWIHDYIADCDADDRAEAAIASTKNIR